MDVVGDDSAGRDHPMADEYPGERRGQRLRHRHQQMRVAWPHPAAVVLEQHCAVVHDHQSVGVRRFQHLGQRPPPIVVRKGERLERARSPGQRIDAVGRAADPCRASQLADVKETPPVEWRVDPIRRVRSITIHSVNVGLGESLRASRGRRFTICTMLAERLNNLGTETAFAVSLAAAEWAAKGNKVFPFHLGDINLPTPANVVEAMNRAIADGKTGYCAGSRDRSAARGIG